MLPPNWTPELNQEAGALYQKFKEEPVHTPEVIERYQLLFQELMLKYFPSAE